MTPGLLAPVTWTCVPSGSDAESQPSVDVAAPVPEQWAAWPMYVLAPSEYTKFAVHWAPSVTVWTPGWTAPVPAADTADGANAMIASAQMPARTHRGDIPLPSFELWSAAPPDGRGCSPTQSQRSCHRAGSLA